MHHGENPEENPSISKDTLHRKEGSIAVKGSEGPDGVNRENFLLGENLWRVKVKKQEEVVQKIVTSVTNGGSSVASQPVVLRDEEGFGKHRG